MDTFEDILRKDLRQFLLSMKEVDERMPECPNVEDKWESIAKAYIPDGIREFQDFPSASLGWMMYIGMAVAKMWDTDWEIYSKVADLYAYMRDKRGYDNMDEYILDEVLDLHGMAAEQMQEPVCIAIRPDHPTPVELRIHVNEPVPFLIYYKGIEPDEVQQYDEVSCVSGGYGLLRLQEFMQTFMNVPSK
jgi:hypothetical protein